MWGKTRKDGSKRLKRKAVPTQFFFTDEENQYTSVNTTIIEGDPVYQSEIKYKNTLEKMVKFEKQFDHFVTMINFLRNYSQYLTKKCNINENDDSLNSDEVKALNKKLMNITFKLDMLGLYNMILSQNECAYLLLGIIYIH